MTRPVARLLRTLLAAFLVLALCLAPAAPVLGANHASEPVREQPRQTISAASKIFAAVDAEGGLWVWGEPFRRYAPYSSLCRYTSRTPQKILDGVVFVDTCSGAVAAIRADGSLWMMGYSDMMGNGGQGTYTGQRFPTVQSVPLKMSQNGRLPFVC